MLQTQQAADFAANYLKTFSSPKSGEMKYPILRVSKKGFTIRTKTDEWENLDTELTLDQLKWVRVILKATQYQAYYETTKGDLQTKKIIWESEEFVNIEWQPQKFLFFNYADKKSYSDLSNSMTIKSRMSNFVPSGLELRLENREIVYLDIPSIWVVKTYLKLTQTVGMVNRELQFKDPVKDWLRYVLNVHWAKIIDKVFDLNSKWNWATLETYYPVFTNATDKPDEWVFEKAKDIFQDMINSNQSKRTKTEEEQQESKEPQIMEEDFELETMPKNNVEKKAVLSDDLPFK